MINKSKNVDQLQTDKLEDGIVFDQNENKGIRLLAFYKNVEYNFDYLENQKIYISDPRFYNDVFEPLSLATIDDDNRFNSIKTNSILSSCFTDIKNIDSLSMWTHYANKSEGFAVEYLFKKPEWSYEYNEAYYDSAKRSGFVITFENMRIDFINIVYLDMDKLKACINDCKLILNIIDKYYIDWNNDIYKNVLQNKFLDKLLFMSSFKHESFSFEKETRLMILGSRNKLYVSEGSMKNYLRLGDIGMISKVYVGSKANFYTKFRIEHIVNILNETIYKDNKIELVYHSLI